MIITRTFQLLGKLDHHMEKKNDPYLTPYTKTNSKQIKSKYEKQNDKSSKQ